MIEGLIRETAGQRADEIMKELRGTRHAILVAGRPVLGQLVPLSSGQHWMNDGPPTVAIDSYTVLLQALTECLRGREPSTLVDFLSVWGECEVVEGLLPEGTLEEVMTGEFVPTYAKMHISNGRTRMFPEKPIAQSTMFWRGVEGRMRRDWHQNFSARDLTFEVQDTVFVTETHLLAALLYSIWKHPRQLDETEEIDYFWTLSRGSYSKARAADDRAAVIVNNLERMAKRFSRERSCLVAPEYILHEGRRSDDVNCNIDRDLDTNALYALTLAALGLEEKAKAVLGEIEFRFAHVDGYGVSACLPNGSPKRQGSLAGYTNTEALCLLGMAKAGIGDVVGATDIADLIESKADEALPVPGFLNLHSANRDPVGLESLGPTAAYALLLNVLGKRVKAFRRLETTLSLRRITQPRPLDAFEEFAVKAFGLSDDECPFYRGKLSSGELLMAAFTYANLARQESLFEAPR